jgi:outer membrane protein assembly factor BamB
MCGALVAPLWSAEPDWPQFRGPKRDGVSTETGLLKSWPEDGPPIVWVAKGVGEGYSSVVVVGDKVITMGDRGDANYLFAVSRTDGTNLWEAKVGKSGGGGGYPGPRCTPTIAGNKVYGIGQHGEMVCVNLADGKEVWRVDFKKDFKGSSGGWQYSESPLVDGEKVVVTPGGKEATMLALNKDTGKVIWKGFTPDGEAAGYSSIVVSNAAGKKQYVTLTSKGVVSFNAADGKLLWRFGASSNRFADNTANIPTVILYDAPNQLFAAAGYNRGGAVFTVMSSGGKIEPVEDQWSEKVKNKHGGIIRVGKYLYGDLDDSGRIWCADAKTLEIKWSRARDNSRASGSASLMCADGMLYVRHQNGYVSLVEATPEAYKLVSSFKLAKSDGNNWAHPVVVGGKMYIRQGDLITCFNVKK